jgi:hypothetical protein
MKMHQTTQTYYYRIHPLDPRLATRPVTATSTSTST